MSAIQLIRHQRTHNLKAYFIHTEICVLGRKLSKKKCTFFPNAAAIEKISPSSSSVRSILPPVSSIFFSLSPHTSNEKSIIIKKKDIFFTLNIVEFSPIAKVFFSSFECFVLNCNFFLLLLYANYFAVADVFFSIFVSFSNAILPMSTANGVFQCAASQKFFLASLLTS